MSIKVIVLRYARPGNFGIYDGFNIFGWGGEGGTLSEMAPGERVKHA